MADFCKDWNVELDFGIGKIKGKNSVFDLATLITAKLIIYSVSFICK